MQKRKRGRAEFDEECSILKYPPAVGEEGVRAAHKTARLAPLPQKRKKTLAKRAAREKSRRREICGGLCLV